MRQISAVLAVLLSVLFSFKAEAALQVRTKDGKTVTIVQVGDPVCSGLECYPISRGDRFEDIKRADGRGLTVEQIVYFRVPEDPRIPRQLWGTYPNLAAAFTVVGDRAEAKRYPNARLGILTPEGVEKYAKEGRNLRFGLRSSLPDLAVVLPKSPDPCLATPEGCRAGVDKAVQIAQAVESCAPDRVYDPVSRKCVARVSAAAADSRISAAEDCHAKPGLWRYDFSSSQCLAVQSGVVAAYKQPLFWAMGLLILALGAALTVLASKFRSAGQEQNGSRAELARVEAGLVTVEALFRADPSSVDDSWLMGLPQPLQTLFRSLRQLRRVLDAEPTESLEDAAKRPKTFVVEAPSLTTDAPASPKTPPPLPPEAVTSRPPPPPVSAGVPVTLPGMPKLKEPPAGTPPPLPPVSTEERLAFNRAKMQLEGLRAGMEELTTAVDAALAEFEVEDAGDGNGRAAPIDPTERLGGKLALLVGAFRSNRSDLLRAVQEREAFDAERNEVAQVLGCSPDETVLQAAERAAARLRELEPLTDSIDDEARHTQTLVSRNGGEVPPETQDPAKEPSRDSVMMRVARLEKLHREVRGGHASLKQRVALLEVHAESYERLLVEVHRGFEQDLPPIEAFLKEQSEENAGPAHAAFARLQDMAAVLHHRTSQPN